MIVLAAALAALGAVEAQVRCVDAARIAARAVARGDDEGAAAAAARSAAPPGAVVSVSHRAGLVHVRVGAHVALGPGGLGGIAVAASAVASDETLSSATVP